MKLTTLLLVIVLVQASAKSFSQQITLRENNAPLTKVINAIKKQSGYVFLFDQSVRNEKITVQVNKAGIEETLNACFDNTAIAYQIDGNNIFLKKREPNLIQRIAGALALPVDVRGTVVDEKGQPLPGVTVTVKGTSQRVPTDVDGKFYLADVDDKATLVITFIGYRPREVAVKAQLGTIQLEVLQSELQEVVVAYGKTTQQALTGAVTTIKGSDIQNLPNRSFDKSLQGLVPGLLVTSGTGQPGGGLSNFVLRGIATGYEINAGETVRNPLIVIDGVPVSQDPFQIQQTSATAITNPIAQLNPSDIETISVLKDASAISLYGSKASNGVILITTKRGKAGKTQFTFRHQTDMASRLAGKNQVLDQLSYLGLLFEAYRNFNPVIYAANGAVLADLRKKFPIIVNAPGDTSFYAAPDWFKELYNDHAITRSNELSISGGNDRSNFYINFEYTKQDGVARNSGYDRKSLRFNFENRPADWFKFGINTALSYNIQNYSGAGDGTFPGGVPYQVSPLNPIRSATGDYIMNYNYGLTSSQTVFIANPAAANQYNINRNTSYRALSKIYGEIQFLKYLTFSSNFGVDFMLVTAKEKLDKRLSDGNTATGIGRIQERDITTANLISTNILKFDRAFATDHHVNILAGQEAQVLNNKFLDVGISNISNPVLDQIVQQGGTTSSYNGLTTKETLLSYFGQANYAYRNKYFLSSSIRTDGSSKFGEGRKFGTFWSTGLGWVITEESWLKNGAGFLNYLKLRGSLGAAGNSAAINRITKFDPLTLSGYAGNTAVIPNTSASPGNPDIRWEQTFTWDGGIELRLLDNRVSFTADYYQRKTSDVIYLVNLPLETGFNNILSNIGKMENRGIELSLAGDIIKDKAISWKMNINWSSNQNKLVEANVPLASVGSNILGNEVGRNFNSFYMPVWAGVDPATGRPLWFDASGKPTSAYSAAKKEFVGKSQPDGFGAITNTFGYQRFLLSASFYYQYGFQIYEQTSLLNDGVNPYINQDIRALDRWQKPGDIASNPRRVLNNTDGGTNISTRYLYSGDYIRLANLAMSYDFAPGVLSRLHLKAFKIYVQGNNLATWTKNSGTDPGTASVRGVNAYAYPNAKTFSLGFNATF